MNELAIMTFTQLHDAVLSGIFLKDKQLHLCFCTPARQEMTLTVSSVSALKCDNFKDNNIVFDVLVFNLDSCPTDLLMYASSYSEQDGRRCDINIEGKLDFLRNSGGSCLYLATSYGCSLAVISDSAASCIVLEEKSTDAPF